MTDHGLDLGADFASEPGTAFVVGGSGGLGAEICRALAARGSAVAFSYRHNEDAAQVLAAEIADLGQPSWTVGFDLTDHRAIAGTIDAVAEAADGIHTVVYAAGPHVPQRHLSKVSPGAMQDQLHSDAAGFFAVASVAIPHLRLSEGSITAITSAAVRRHAVRDGLSTVPKAAVEATVRAIAVEEGRYGVRANSVGPGMLSDGMAERLIAAGDLDEAALEAARSNTPMGKFGTSGDIAEAVCFLASRRARFITGQHVDVDGGFTV